MNHDEYTEVLAPIVSDYRKQPYSFWIPILSGEPIVLDVQAKDGSRCCVEINAYWDDAPDADIRVILSIDDGGYRAFVPLTDSFIIAPGGKFVGE